MAARVPRIEINCSKANSSHYLKKAQQYCVQNNYTQAYEYFVHYFESLKDPSEASTSVQTVFTKIVCKVAAVLKETDNVEELLKCYLQALNLFPNDHVILNNLGAYMFKLEEIDIARRYLELAIKANEHYLPAEKNLLHLKWHELPRWHFRMLNDKTRNTAYDSAITSLVNKGYKDVVDIGAGCGLLSLIASKNPEANVIAIESNRTLAKMCMDILEEHKIENVKVFNCYSTDFKEPLEKCNLIVTETFDVALFGERVLESIYHALTVLRTEEDFKIIPAGAKVYITGIHASDLYSKYQYVPKSSLKCLHLDDVCVIHREWEPYEAEYLGEQKFELMTDIQKIYDKDFSNQQQIYDLLNVKDEHKLIQLRCKEGVIHAVVLWFDLHLTEDVWITTNPMNDDSAKCWEQAVIYLDHPIYAKEGDTLTLAISLEDCKLSVMLLNEEPMHECYRVSKEIVSFLNDDKLIETYLSIANSLMDKQLTVVDFNAFPLVGLLLAKKGCLVYHMIKSDCDRSFLEHLLCINGIPMKRFLMIEEGVSSIDIDLIKQRSLVFADVVNTDGSLKGEFVQSKDLVGSIHIPKVVKLHATVVYASYIDYCNKVDDANTLGFKIGKYINQYTGNEHPNLEGLQHETYSNIACFSVNDGVQTFPVLISKSGLVNAIYCWYEIEYYEGIQFSTLDSSHYRKTCFFMEEPKVVNVMDVVFIQLEVDASLMKLTAMV